MARSKIEVTDFAALKKYGEDKGYLNLVRIVQKEEADPKLLRKLVNSAQFHKIEIPGVTFTAGTPKDPNQTELEDKISQTAPKGPEAAKVSTDPETAKTAMQPKSAPAMSGAFGNRPKQAVGSKK